MHELAQGDATGVADGEEVVRLEAEKDAVTHVDVDSDSEGVLETLTDDVTDCDVDEEGETLEE